VCYFLLCLLICIFDMFVYITKPYECTNLRLLRSDAVNYFLVQSVLYLLNWCCYVIIFRIKSKYDYFHIHMDFVLLYESTE
jgi:hypothetical protein